MYIPPEMYTVGTLKKVKCTRSLLELLTIDKPSLLNIHCFFLALLCFCTGNQESSINASTYIFQSRFVWKLEVDSLYSRLSIPTWHGLFLSGCHDASWRVGVRPQCWRAVDGLDEVHRLRAARGRLGRRLDDLTVSWTANAYVGCPRCLDALAVWWTESAYASYPHHLDALPVV